MHAGESVSLSDAEQRKLFDFAIKQVKGRVPVIAHVSDSGTAIAADRARYAEKAGAAAVIATSTYYWTPPAAMVLEHFAQIGAAVKIPFFMFTRPTKWAASTTSDTDMVLKLIDRLRQFRGRRRREPRLAVHDQHRVQCVARASGFPAAVGH